MRNPELALEIANLKLEKIVNAICECQKSLDEPDGERELADKLVKIFPDYGEFYSTYFRTKNADAVPKRVIKKDFDEDDRHFIMTADVILRKYLGLIGLNKKDNKPGEISLDTAKEIVEDYIKLDDFGLDIYCSKTGVSKLKFSLSLKKVQEELPELYELYRTVTKFRLQTRLEEPIDKVTKIVNGISTGMNENDEEFTVLDFYRLAPWKGNSMGDKHDLDALLRIIGKNFPEDNLEFQKTKQEFRQAKTEKTKAKLEAEGSALAKSIKSDHINYGELVGLFTSWMLGEEAGKVMLDYVAKNNIGNFTLVYEACEKIKYTKTPVDENGLTVEDIENIFDEISRCGYPKCLEVFNILKKQRIDEIKNTPSDKKIYELSDDLTNR